MAKIDILARVDSDLTRGHTHLATQRLASLIAAYPSDLALRARLAAVHRRTGNAAEAGRWGYLTEEVTEAETTAFTRAVRPAGAQLRALRLRGEHPAGLGPFAQARYASMIERVEAETGRPVEMTSGGPVSTGDRILDFLAGCVFFGSLLLLAAVMGIGLVTVIRWVF